MKLPFTFTGFILLCCLAICTLAISRKKMDLPKDPFKFLGIPAFDLKLPSEREKLEKQAKIPDLKSLADLPRFFESGGLKTVKGMKVLTRFLS